MIRTRLRMKGGKPMKEIIGTTPGGADIKLIMPKTFGKLERGLKGMLFEKKQQRSRRL